MKLIPSRVKPVTVFLGVALAFGASASFATPTISVGNFTLNADYILGASSGTTTDGLTDASASLSGSDYSLYKSVDSNSVFFHTYGYDSWFGARAFGTGSFYAQTSVNYRDQITNASSVAQSLIFSFGVSDGELSIGGNGTGFADLLLRVRINGVDVARDQTTMQLTGSGISCSSNDLGLLSGYMNCAGSSNGIYANGQNYTLNLGLINAGESVTLDYDIISTVSADLIGGTAIGTGFVCDQYSDGYGDGYGYGTADSEWGGVCVSGHFVQYTYETEGEATARSGDPLNYTFSPVGISVSLVNAVPEPSTLALLASALFGVGATRRRKSRK